MLKTHQQILAHIQAKNKGSIFFTSNFIGMGSNDAIRQGLSRLVKQNVLARLGKGIYLYPEHDTELGILYPSTEKIAEAIAQQEKAKIIPTGSLALYKLGLSTQIPLKAVYLTNGVRRKIKVGRRTITFKITTPKKLATKGKFSTVVIQALEELGKENINEAVIKKIKPELDKEDHSILKEDLKLTSAWIAELIISLTKKEKNDRMVTA